MIVGEPSSRFPVSLIHLRGLVLLLFILPCRNVLTSFVLGSFKQARPGNDGCGQLEANSVRIEKVNRLDRVMVGDSEHIDAGGAQFRHRGLESGDRIDAQGEMIHPWRRIRRGFGGLPIAKVEKRDARSIRHTKEDMRMRGVFLRARHTILRYYMHQRQPKDVFVKVARLLRVAASIGEMMQTMDWNEGRHFGTSCASFGDGER